MNLGSLGQRERFLLAILAILAPIGAWQYLKPVLLDLTISSGRWHIATINVDQTQRNGR